MTELDWQAAVATGAAGPQARTSSRRWWLRGRSPCSFPTIGF